MAEGIEKADTTNLSISDDYTNTKVILNELIKAHGESANRSRERSLVVTKLLEARMWVQEAQAQA
jgi:hypothetical protein